MEYKLDSDEHLSEAVVVCVSRFEDTDFTALPPLYETIDPDGLNRIFNDGSNARLVFIYSKSLVNVYNGESITVETA